ncbi:MAG TPA: hypothetical protein VKR06_18700, partial [Ktedonosporobacter sp.]|nr:hypothetical protein [Ktedonosporobacter sp.]
MLTSWKSAVVLVATLLILFSVLLPVLVTAQAAHNTSQVPQGLFILKATRIDTTNARLQMLPDPLRPIFSFETATLQNLQILAPANNGLTLVSSASGLTFATNVAIKTLTGYEIASALQSFTNKADLLVLALGGTVSHLSMVNVSLPIDTYLKNGTLSIVGLHISLSSSAMAVSPAPNLSIPNVIATLTPPCTATSTPASVVT